MNFILLWKILKTKNENKLTTNKKKRFQPQTPSFLSEFKVVKLNKCGNFEIIL